jgi:Flp pilus assembly protein TadD
MDHAEQAFHAYHEGTRLLHGHNPHAAAVALERARELEPEQGSVREALARAYFRSGNLSGATEEFAKAVDLDPVNDYAHFGLGLCLLRTGDALGARRHLKLATAMRPDSADYRNALARALAAS